MKTNERLREIREHHLHHDYPQEQCQRCFLLARLDEVVKVLQSLPLEDFTDDMANHDAAEFVDHAGDFFEAMQLARRFLAELEKGE